MWGSNRFSALVSLPGSSNGVAFKPPLLAWWMLDHPATGGSEPPLRRCGQGTLQCVKAPSNPIPPKRVGGSDAAGPPSGCIGEGELFLIYMRKWWRSPYG